MGSSHVFSLTFCTACIHGEKKHVRPLLLLFVNSIKHGVSGIAVVFFCRGLGTCISIEILAKQKSNCSPQPWCVASPNLKNNPPATWKTPYYYGILTKKSSFVWEWTEVEIVRYKHGALQITWMDFFEHERGHTFKNGECICTIFRKYFHVY